ncbi:cytochrome c oxidase assembly protein [Streptomyces sp. NPDC060002]|uniref:cytochrome c oxidase assembly protein n=1 Tax=Streptomyces sp. NPDC060002 TaxID=3347033 RepID=UPI0036A1E57A
MSLAHVHPGTTAGPGTAELITAAAALLVVVAYLSAAGRLRRRGDAWPRHRDASFGAGGVAMAWAAAGALPPGPFTGHMLQHVAVGMAAPLLLVSARPLTLVLRSLGPGRARRGLLALAHSRVVGALVFPPLAAMLDVGGLWLLYRTELYSAIQHSPLLGYLVHAHLLAAGLLFSFSVCQLDPMRRRWGVAVRGGALLAAGAAHAVLAKTLYALPPPGTGFAAADLHGGALLMYYGGDMVEVAMATVVGLGWFRARGRTYRGSFTAPRGGSVFGSARAAGPVEGRHRDSRPRLGRRM